MLVRKQRRVAGKKQNYWLDTDTGTEYSSKPTRKVHEVRSDKGKRRVPEYISKGKAAASAYARRCRCYTGFKDELTVLATAECKELVRVRSSETRLVWEVDHMLPLKGQDVSGLHCADNLQVIPKALNRAKGNRRVYTERGEWLRELKA